MPSLPSVTTQVTGLDEIESVTEKPKQLKTGSGAD